MSAEDKNIAYFTKGTGWNLCCKQATYLLLKKEEQQQLSFKEETALKFHMSICKFCRAFKIQSAMMNDAIKQSLSEMVLMPQGDKEKLKLLINNNLNKS